MNIPVREPGSLLGDLVQEFRARRLSTVDMIARILREAIVRGVLAQGMAIRQDHIAAELGISKIPLREALSKLEGQGLVTMVPRRGAVVTAVSPAQIEEIYQVRLALEPQLLRAAVPLIAEPDFAEAEGLVSQMEQCETEEFGKLNWRFHRVLYAPSKRELTLQILDILHIHVDRFVRLHMGLIDMSRASNVEHRRILDACHNQDIEFAIDLLRAHLDGIRRSMDDFFSREPFDLPAADKAVP